MIHRIAEDEVEQAWRKARPISGRDPALYRIAPDVIGSIIRRDQYDMQGEFGWRIEYGRPVAYRATSTETAIRALQRETTDDRGRRDAGGRQSRG